MVGLDVMHETAFLGVRPVALRTFVWPVWVLLRDVQQQFLTVNKFDLTTRTSVFNMAVLLKC